MKTNKRKVYIIIGWWHLLDNIKTKKEKVLPVWLVSVANVNEAIECRAKKKKILPGVLTWSSSAAPLDFFFFRLFTFKKSPSLIDLMQLAFDWTIPPSLSVDRIIGTFYYFMKTPFPCFCLPQKWTGYYIYCARVGEYQVETLVCVFISSGLQLCRKMIQL